MLICIQLTLYLLEKSLNQRSHLPILRADDGSSDIYTIKKFEIKAANLVQYNLKSPHLICSSTKADHLTIDLNTGSCTQLTISTNAMYKNKPAVIANIHCRTTASADTARPT